LYLTGEGQTNPPGVDGKPATAPAPQPLLPLLAIISGQQTGIAYAGGSPGLVAGIMQANIVIPVGLVTNTTGPVAVPVLFQVGTMLTQANVTVYVTR
jgi:uncharacterized protein (TIGR03437 family)